MTGSCRCLKNNFGPQGRTLHQLPLVLLGTKKRQFKSEVQRVLMMLWKVLREGFDSQGAGG
jgi:hypothetical protein